MTIRVTYKDNDLTIFVVIGELAFAELMATFQATYNENPTLNFLWDIRQGTLKNLSSENITAGATFVKSISAKRMMGKTAVVTAHDIDYGIGRMMELYGENKELPFEIRIFRDYAEAVMWLENKLA